MNDEIQLKKNLIIPKASHNEVCAVCGKRTLEPTYILKHVHRTCIVRARNHKFLPSLFSVPDLS